MQSRKVKWQKMFLTTGVSANQDQTYIRDAMRTQEFPPTPEQQCAGRASRDYTQQWNSASRRECQGHTIQRPKGMICRALTGDRANVYRLEATTGSPGSTAIVRVVPSPTSVSQSSLCSRGQSSMAGITIRCSIFALIRVITACAASPRPPPLLAAKRYHTI